MSGRFDLKDYATVDERIDSYWGMHPKPEGSIQTEIIWVSNDGNSVAIKATVYQGDRILATGIAQEERLEGLDQYGKPLKGANSTSWWENCETSAIGRALANMNMSLSKQRPSREEMQKVQRYDEQDAKQPPAYGVVAYEPANQSARPARTPPAPSAPRPAAAPVAAGTPYTKEEYEAAIKVAWQMQEAGDNYAAIVAYMRTLRSRLTPDQLEDSREEVRLIKAAIYPEVLAVS